MTTRAMGDRSAQIAMEWVCKCADVVMEAREAESGRAGRGGSVKANRWFNAPTTRRRETTRVAAGCGEDDDGSFGGGGGGGFRERVVVVDVFLEREASSSREDEDADEAADDDATPANERATTKSTTSGRQRELVERWAFHAGADGESVGGNNHFNKDLETSLVYKRAVVMIRTLIALSRTLPTHGARLRAMRRRGIRGGKSSSGVTLAFELRDAGEGMDLASAHPGKALGFQTFAFADVPTSIGKLRACVYFLDQMAVHALEEAFIDADEAMHAAAAIAVESPENVATTPKARRAADRLDASLGRDVALAGGEMSLSPSPSGKGDDRAARSGDRRRQSAGLTRGLLLDDASPSPSPSAKPPAPTRGGMTASLSSGSLQLKPSASPAAVPLADYTSPNYQRFDNAPSSAPSAGPAPIYGFNASPTVDTRKTIEETNASARAATKVEPLIASPKRRSTMSSCLKIDDEYASRKTGDDRGGVAPGAAAPPIIGAASSPIFAPGAAKRATAVSTPPSSGGVFPRASPIACSPGLPHASPQSTPESRGGPGSHARYASGSPSPWGGFVCPESPVPGFFGGTSPGSAARSSPSSSSLGTSLRDVVGVYPHSPGGVSAAAAAFARRMSGASDDVGSPLSRDDETDFPFAFDDADPHATSVEHTPADLLHLLEDSSTLRRKSTDGPLPLDAALDDDGVDARDVADENDAPVARLKASVADAPRARAGLTLSDALDALRELKPPRDDR